jgi:hypothetical protein
MCESAAVVGQIERLLATFVSFTYNRIMKSNRHPRPISTHFQGHMPRSLNPTPAYDSCICLAGAVYN